MSERTVRLAKDFYTVVFTGMLAGISTSFISDVLIYFKQKPIIHHGLALLVVLLILFAFDIWSRKDKQLSYWSRSIALVAMIILGSLMPQFLYQVRPYTFYISGIAMAGVLTIAISSRLTAGQLSGNGFVFKLVFVLAYFAGTLLSSGVMQAIIFVLLVLLVIVHLLEKGSSTKVLPVSALLFVVVVYWQFSKPVKYFEDQQSFEDKVIFSASTQYHDLVITQWQEDHWFFIDKLKNFSSIDEYLYYEPMVHSVMKLVPDASEILVIGGENGCLLRELLKWQDVTSIDLVSYDTILRNLGLEEELFLQMNNGALKNDAIKIVGQDIFNFVNECYKKYHAVFIDLPDPRDIETNQYYTIEFFMLIEKILADDGMMITQAGSPYFATEAYFSIGKTLRNAGFSALPLHNQILTLGEWGWYICSSDLTEGEVKSKLISPIEFPISTRWYNEDATHLISSFGKTYFDTLQVGINTLDNPLVYQYYLKGNWKLN